MTDSWEDGWEPGEPPEPKCGVCGSELEHHPACPNGAWDAEAELAAALGDLYADAVLLAEEAKALEQRIREALT